MSDDSKDDRDAGGRPTKYDPAYCEEARKICQLFNATDEELAEFFGVARSAISRWKVEHPEFERAIRLGKTLTDAEVADRLVKRALGYKHLAYTFHVINGKIVSKRYVKHYPPDTMAGMYWLNNRQRKHWKTRHNVEHTVLTEDIVKAIDLGMLTDDELEQLSAGKITAELIARITAAVRTPQASGKS